MTAYTIRNATNKDLVAITALANRNVFDKLSPADREAGFLTGRFELPAIKKMVASATSLVALFGSEIAGFVINSKLPPNEYPPLVKAMIRKFPELHYRDLPLTAYSYFFYGPVLVNKRHRGQGLLTRLFRKTQESLCGRYEIGLAFIHEQNHHSLTIHTHHLGLEILGQFSFNSENYHLLVFPIVNNASSD